MSEDRFRFPDFFILRVKIKVIRSREWIRYVVEILRFDDQAFVAKISDALNLKRTFELIKEQTSNRRKNLIFFPNKEDLMKRIVRGTSKTDSLRSYIAGTNDRTDRGAKAGGT